MWITWTLFSQAPCLNCSCDLSQPRFGHPYYTSLISKNLIIALLILNLGTEVTWWLASHFGHFLPKKNATCNYWIGSWVCPRFFLVAMEKRNSSPCLESNYGFPKPVACSVHQTNFVVDIYRYNHVRDVIASRLLISNMENKYQNRWTQTTFAFLLILTEFDYDCANM